MKFLSAVGFTVETALTSAAGKASLPSRPPFDSGDSVYDGILMHDERFNKGSPSDTVLPLKVTFTVTLLDGSEAL